MLSPRAPFTRANQPTRSTALRGRLSHGFSVIELLIVMIITGILLAIAVPKFMTSKQQLETSGDSRKLASLVAEAKLRAAADFTHARLYANLSSNTFHLEYWNKAGNGGAGCWATDGDTANACTASGSPVISLSDNVRFGFGSIGTTDPPANTESTLAQAPACFTGYAGQSTNTSSTANTACIEFNSRGVPSDPDPGGTSGASGGVPDATGALYVTDGQSVYGTTVLATGMIQNWYAPNGSSPTWKQR